MQWADCIIKFADVGTGHVTLVERPGQSRSLHYEAKVILRALSDVCPEGGRVRVAFSIAGSRNHIETEPVRAARRGSEPTMSVQ